MHFADGTEFVRFDGGKFKDGWLPNCSALQYGRSLPTFHRYLLSPLSEPQGLTALKTKAASTSETSAIFSVALQPWTQPHSRWVLNARDWSFRLSRQVSMSEKLPTSQGAISPCHSHSPVSQRMDGACPPAGYAVHHHAIMAATVPVCTDWYFEIWPSQARGSFGSILSYPKFVLTYVTRTSPMPCFLRINSDIFTVCPACCITGTLFF
jgi:hypothetical protein